MNLLTVVYIISLIVVGWAVVDIIRQPTWSMSGGRKLAWAAACILGWLVLGIVGAVAAGIYLGVVRPRLPARR
jgi:hypothetical protein